MLEEKAEMLKERRRHEALLAGLPTSAIYNVHRKRGQRAYRPHDFVKTERRHMTVEEAETFLERWAAEHNRRVAEA